MAALLWLGGSLLIFADDGGRKGFQASPVQLVFAAGVALALIAAALLRRRGHVDTGAATAPRPVWAGLLVAVAYAGASTLSGWPGIGVALALAAVTAVLLTRWSRRPGWGQLHVLAAGSASVLAAAVSAYDVPTYSPSSPAADLTGDVAISVIVLLLVGGAWWRISGRAARDRRRAAEPAGHPASPPA
ncbi:hypothetical protein [Micromonospora sp. WMMD975]|uniref:hypothetical protein n=1 Tax=Micromonospora sp. WMMD975 TaxID=3016087 RepID=UPI00249A8849|nr:hypothetical protein [Micromonospora sp. WMMD975]WFE33360.1 hypothetical protein O7613_28205 [Micromonospora sp. WMMD975]